MAHVDAAHTDAARTQPDDMRGGRLGLGPALWHGFAQSPTEKAMLELEDGSRGTPIRSQALSDRSRYWAGDNAWPAVGLYAEKTATLGEDAEPTYLRYVEAGSEFDGRTLIAVYDGLGGSGARIIGQHRGRSVSQAYIASRSARLLTERWHMESLSDVRYRGPVQLENRLRDGLSDLQRRFAEELPQTQSRVRSKMQRQFPTTLAAVEVARSARSASRFNVAALWAGDSRCYLWTQTAGLQQLSRDHARDSDALSQLVNDSPMTNVVSADPEWFIDSHSVDVTGPFVVLCASDGVHGYVQTPGMLECHFAAHLAASQCVEEWIAGLTSTIVGYTADDATLVAAPFGFDSFDAMRDALTERLPFLVSTQRRPFAEIDSHDTGAVRSAQARSWAIYRDLYEAVIPPVRVPTT